MDAISVDIAGSTTEDRNGLSFEEFAEIAWAILQSTYSGDNDVEVLRYNKFESRNTDEQFQHTLSAVAYHIDEGLSLSEIVRTRRNISKPAHTQRSKDDINTYRLHSLIKRAIVVTGHVDQEYGVHPSGGINGDSNNKTALFADPCENLVVHVHGHKDTPRVELRFPKTRALQSFITYVTDTFGQLGQSLSLHPNSPLKDLNLISSLNRHCIQRLARAPSKLSTACLGDILLQQGIERPEQLAIDSWDGTFTYSELHYLSFRLAAVLLDQDIAPEERILLCMKKSKWAIVAMFGILLAGATCIPLDINSPQKRLRTIREKVVARVAVVDDSTASLFEQMGMKTVTSSAQLEHTMIPKIPLPKTAASATAFIYFTSGSTGTPKGVVLQHGALMASIIEVAKAYSLDDTSRVFQFAAYTFDVSMGDIFGTTSAGGCLCIPSEEERMDHVAAAMNRLGATHACLTSTVLAHIEPKDVISLRYLFVGGEALDRAQFARWKQHVNFNVVYGTTESLIWDSLATSCQLELDASTLGLSIGSWLWIVHPQEAENLKPIGAIGEILVEGPLLAEGYLEDPVTTSSKFISAPQWLHHLRQDSQVRCYKTGDMGYYNANGTVTFVGRLDTQVKIRGQRIELEEIERSISLLEPSFKQVVVEAVTLKSHQRSKTLTAFVHTSQIESTEHVNKRGHGRGQSLPASLNKVHEGVEVATKDDIRDLALPGSQSLTDLFQQCQRKVAEVLPHNMIPSLFIPMQGLPRALTGKLDRKALRQWAADLSHDNLANYQLTQSVTARRPETTNEKCLQRLWSRLLDITEVSLTANDHFFQLSGDSVLAMELVNKLRSEGKSLSVKQIFENPRLCDMAIQINSVFDVDMHEAHMAPFVLVQPKTHVFECVCEAARACKIDCLSTIEDIYPATPMQEAVLAISAHHEGAYRHQAVFKLPSTLDLRRFVWAWETLVAMHSIFRTRLVLLQDYGLLQIVFRPGIAWRNNSSLKQYLREDIENPMSYGTELSRFALVTDRDDGETHFVWSGHHAIYDGWSLPRAFAQTANIYSGQAMSKPIVPFSQFVWYLSKLNLQKMDDFWRAQFSRIGAKFPELPCESYVPAPDQLRKFTVKLDRTPRSSITTATLIQAAWALVTAQQAGTDRAVFGLTLSGRDAQIPGIIDILGPTMATVPLEIDVSSSSQSIASFLEDLQTRILHIKQYQHIGLQRIRRLSSQAKWASTFQNLLVIHPAEKGETYHHFTSELGTQLVDSTETDFLDYCLTMKCTVGLGVLHIKIHFDGKVVSDLQVQRLMQRFEHVISQLAKESSVSVGEVQTASPLDFQQLTMWNDVPSIVFTTVHGMVEEQVRQRPGAIATIGFDGIFTYAELDCMATMLAQDLAHVGAGPEVRVVLCFTKSTWPIVAMLATLKCGGVCVSISPDEPDCRARDICEDVEATILLCDVTCKHRFLECIPNVLVVDSSLISKSRFFENSQRPLSRPTVLPSNAAFVVYTSGSTGKPKGSLLEHQSICTCLNAVGVSLQAGPHSRVLQFCAYTFDMHILEIFCTLAFGGSICVISEAERMDDLSAVISRGQVNTLIMTPTVTRLLSSATVSLIDTLLVSGEPLTRQEVERWAPNVRLINGLGPSECCPLACVTSPLTSDSDPLCIGRPIGCQIWITEPGNPDHLLPIGCIGEMLVEGPIVGRGYINRPEVTSAAFIFNPLWSRNQSNNAPGHKRRFYRSGDLAQYNFDGTITFIGRANDDQIKVHGQRVELGEIEYHLKQSQSENFEQVAVAAIPIESRGSMKAIVAFVRFAVSSGNEAGPDPLLDMNEERLSIFRDARHELHHRIPRHMVPTVYVPVWRMPLSINGKLDRNALQQWLSSLDEHCLSQYYLNTTGLARQPQTTEEKCLQKAWAQVLKVPGSISAQDHFFQLGGDSVLAMELVTIIRSIGKSLTVKEIFQRPRLGEMAAGLTSLGTTQEEYEAPFNLVGSETNLSDLIEEAARACNAKPMLIEDIYPATPMQEALLAVSAHRRGAYHFQASFKLPNKFFDIARFKAAWETFIMRQAILRTRIVIVASGLGTVQVVLNSPVDWFRGVSFVQYLQQDYETPMTYGTELSRYAIVTEGEGGKSDTNPSYFIWSGHHAVYDGWSLPRAFETVSRIYEGQAPRPVVPYSQFVRYIRELNIETMDDFWRDQFPDTTDQFPSVPSNYVPAPGQFRCFTVDLDRGIKSHITTATLIQAAWAIVTARYMDTDEAIFGLILSGRDLPLHGISEIQGPTIATVPLRISIDNTQSIREFLGDVQNQVLQVKEYQYIGLQRIRNLSPEARSATMFQNLLVIHPTDVEQSYDKLGLGTKFVDCAERDLMDLALTIQCTICPLELKIQVFFDDVIIPSQQLDCILHQFEHVLSQLATESPTTTVYNIETISPFDLEKLTCWNAIVPSAHKATIHELVEAQVLARPSATATTGFDVEWTYQELDSLATALAQRLTRTGKICTETRVALCFHKSSWPIVAILAVLKCGGVCVSISPDHPMRRLLEICNDAEISVLLCDSDNVNKFTPHFPEIIAVNSSLANQNLDPDWVQPDVSSDNAAFVVYSSGSTGKPKGSLLTHQSLCSFLKANTTAAYMSSATKTLQFSSYIFDGHIWEILGALINGGCVCVLSESERMENLADTARKLKVNWAVLTPTVGRLLSPEQVPSLETLILTGEPLLQQDIEKWADGTRLLTGLGPSECSVMSFITEPLTSASKCTNIGRPVGCRVWLADHRRPEQRLVPIGCAGEILIEGPILGRGYINRPQLNAEAFLIDPKWAKGGMSPRKFYRSGDLARHNPDGTFTIIGRKDTQVKVRGQRIELGDIEHHLKRVQPSFEQVAAEVLDVASRGNTKLLAAFVRSSTFSKSLPDKSPFLPQTSELRRTFRTTQRLLAEFLPRYMVPSVFIPLKKLPVNASGKLARKVLRQWIVDLPPNELEQYLLGNSAMIQPVTGQKEQLLQHLWARVLRVPIDSIGADDNFFQLGGDSVTAMELITLLRAKCCLINIADLFERPELRKMAMAVVDGPSHVNKIPDVAPFALILSSGDEHKYVEEAAKVCKIPADLIEDIYPTAPMQEALLAISAQHTETYRCQEIFRLPESLDIARFKSAWEKLVDAYAIFRTRIILTKGLGPVQLVLRSQGEAIWHYSSSLDAYLKQDREEKMAYGEDLNRLAIVNDVDRGESYFIWTGHHAIYDGWSLPKAFEEVVRIYQGQNLQHVVPFNNFIKYINSVDISSAQEYWREQFPTIVEHYPQRPSLAYTPRPLHMREATIPLGSKGESAFTAATTIQAAWALTLARKTQKSYAAFGLTLSGRDVSVVGIEDIIGPTITTVPVRVNVESVQTISGFLNGVQEHMTALRRYQHIGLQNIRHISRELQSAVDFQNLLVIHIENEGSTQLKLSALGINHIEGQAPTLVTNALIVECKVLSDFFQVKFLYDHEIIADAQLECLFQQFKHAFVQLSNAASDTGLDELDMVSQHDLQLIERWTGEPPKATEATVHGLVEAQALLTPEAEAVTGFDGEYSYRSLNLTANKLAAHLRTLGVGLGNHVVLCFTKSTFATVAMLAVLKVGAACVSVSPDSPASNIEGVIDSVGADVLLGDPSNAQCFVNFVKHAVGLDFLFCASLQDLYSDKPQHVLPTDAAFVVFTSGSTGLPKGTILEHRSVCTSMLASGENTFISAQTRALQFSSYAFDAHITEIFATLFRGGCVCVVSENERMNYLTEAMHKRNVNWAIMTPTLADMVDPLSAPSLDTLVLVGEVISPQTFLRWKGHTRLVNGWGPSECAVGASYNSNLQVTDTRNIGFPNGCRIWLTEESRPDRLVPVECVGEILIEGPIVGRGYINQPDAAAFITNPEWSRVRANVIRRFYRTGDLGRYNFDGTITFFGRTDNQVKINGQRVELGEIEFHIKDVLAKSVKRSNLRWSVAAEILTLKEDNAIVLVAFVHVDDSSHGNEEALDSILSNSLLSLKEDLAECVPAYMIPKAFIPLADFPILLSGKVDRKYLREMSASMTLQQLNHLNSSQGTKREPETTEEHHLRDLWATVLGIESTSIGAGDNFLQIGGDSVRAMRLVGLARQQGLVLTVADIFRHPRLCDLARKITHHVENLPESAVPFSLMKGNVEKPSTIQDQVAKLCGVDPSLIEDVFPCTALQEGLLAMTAKRRDDYIAQNVLELQSTVKLARFKQAWQRVWASTSILRTRIVDLESQGLVQTVLKGQMEWSANTNSVDESLSCNEKWGLGTPLTRFVIVEDNAGRKWFIWKIHHAIYDGRSLQLLLDQVRLEYIRQPGRTLTPFQNFVRHITLNRDAEATMHFWHEQLADSVAKAFPALPSASYQPYADKIVQHHITGLSWPTSGVTASTVIRAAWSMLTATYTGTDEVIFGAVVSGLQLPVPDIELTAGPTISTVPVRVKLSQTSTVYELQMKVQAQASEMIAFEQTGLQHIRKLAPQIESASHFQTLLVVQPRKEVTHHLEQEQLLFCEVADARETETAGKGLDSFSTYVLTLICDIEDTGLNLRINFDSKIMQQVEVERLARHLGHLIRQTSREGTTQVGDINIVSDEDMRQIWKWNATAPEPVNRCVHDIFAETVQRHPNSLAVYGENEQKVYRSLTYHELDELSTKLAYHLVKSGIGPGAVVPLCFEKSVWTPVAMLGVMKAGAASVALDSTQPEERLRMIVEQVQGNVILSSIHNESLSRRLVDSSIPVLVPEILTRQHTHTKQSLPLTRPSNILYIVFTSGSTGKPKGAIISHQNFSSAIHYQREPIGLTEKSRVYDYASYSFDAAWWNMLHSFAAGACLCIPSEDGRRNHIAASMVEMNVSFAQLTPTVAKLINPARLPDLQTLVFAGEPVTSEDIAKWSPYVQVKNFYGPAECSVAATGTIITNGGNVSIGRGLGSNTWVLDPTDSDRLAPVGALGELWLEGPLVGQGYLSDPQMTAASFYSDPPWLLNGAPRICGRRGRLYKTGDLVRYNIEGSLSFVGRKDTQVKLRGQRVELGEVEHHVKRALADEDIDIVAEVILPKGSYNSVLVAFFSKMKTSKTGITQLSSISPEVLEERLSQTLPAYMIPSFFIPVDDIPVTGTGKMDRVQMRKTGEAMTIEEFAAAHSGRGMDERREPITAKEHRLRDLWASVLGIDRARIGRHHSFFRLGGDSISSMRLVAQARNQALLLTVTLIFMYPLLSDLAKAAEELTDIDIEVVAPFSLLTSGAREEDIRAQAAAQCQVLETQIQDVMPCTPLQEGLLAMTAKRPASYISRGVFELRDSIDVERFKAAWEDVLAAADILRTRIAQVTREGMVQILLQEQVQWNVSEDLEAYIDHDKQLIMGLGKPLTRFAIATSKKTGKKFFVWTIHHALYDKWSGELILKEVEKAYHGVEMQPLSPFKAFIKHIRGINEEEASRYWRNEFEGSEAVYFPRLPFPKFVPKACHAVRLDATDIHWPQTDITASNIIRMALSVLLAQCTASQDVVFGVTNMGRRAPVPGIDRIAGPTIATVPVRIKLDSDATIEASLDRLQAQDTAMAVYEHTGITQIRRFGPDTRKGSDFQTLLLVQPTLESGEDPSYQELFEPMASLNDNVSDLNGFNTYALMLVFQPRKNGFRLDVSYDVEVISTEQVDYIRGQLEHVVRWICTKDISKMMIKDIVAMLTMPDVSFGILGRHHFDETDEPALPEPRIAQGMVQGQTTVPMTETEIQIRQIWASILGIEASSIAVDDDFLLIGGDSVQAMRLVGLAREKGLSLKVSDIFSSPCLGDLAKLVTKEVTPHQEPLPFALLTNGVSPLLILDAAALQGVELTKADVLDILPVTDFQTECITSAITQPLGRCYHFFMDLPQGTSIQHVRESCIKLWNHLDILRAIFTGTQGQYWQILPRNLQPDISVYRTENNLDLFSRQFYIDDMNNSLSLGNSFNRFLITHTSNEHVRLTMRISHAQYDGVSLGRIQSCFAAYFNGEIPAPNPKFAGFIQHSLQQKGAGRIYWRELLADSTITRLKPSKTATASENSLRNPGDAICVRKMITAPGSRKGATEATLFTASCACVLAKRNSYSDVVFGLVDSGRSGLPAALQDVVGPCNSTIPVRIRFDGEKTIHHVLEQVRAQQIQGSLFATHPFSDIVRNCTDWQEDTKEFGVSLQFQNIVEQPTVSLAEVESSLEVYTRQETVDTEGVFIFAKPVENSWAIEARACGKYHSSESILDFVEELSTMVSGFQ